MMPVLPALVAVCALAQLAPRASSLSIVEYVTRGGGAAPKLALAQCPRTGLRGVIATADIDAGETVLSVPASMAFTATELGMSDAVPWAARLAASVALEVGHKNDKNKPKYRSSLVGRPCAVFECRGASLS